MSIKNSHMWFVYVDYTIENTPRPFYVGKGNLKRVQFIKRNKRHSLTVEKFGINRVIVFSALDEQSAFETETKFVADLHTFIGDDLADKQIASNLSLGGMGGSSGAIRTLEWNNKISQSVLGFRHTEETKQKLRELALKQDFSHLIGKKHSEATKIKIRTARAKQTNIPFKGQKHSDISRAKIKAARAKQIVRSGYLIPIERRERIRQSLIKYHAKIREEKLKVEQKNG